MNTAVINDDTHSRPWYREFWVWFVIALPLAVVVAGIATAVIAIGGADALVVDDFQKVGLVARREGAQEHRAAQLHVVAIASVDRESGQVAVRLEGDAKPDVLRLNLHHPTQPALDRAASLARDSSGLYRGNAGGALGGHWHVRIVDEHGGWRVTGRLDDDRQLIELRGKP